jgi:riboflavin kinase/FMN adenylyltransferase
MDAAVALGRPFRLGGPVVAGRGKGREIGFPTLNMGLPDQVLPAEGVYAGTVMLGADQDDLMQTTPPFPAVFSIGQARTFGESIPLLIEAHLLDAPVLPLAASWMAMDFVAHLRSQHRFSTVDELVTQITADCRQAQGLLARRSG